MAARGRSSSARPGRARRAAASARRSAPRGLPEGEWVALVDGRVVAHAPTYPEIDAVAREMGIESRAIISRVLPKGPVVY